MVRAWELEQSGDLEPLTERHYAFASHINDGDRLDIRRAALALHVSERSAEDIIVRLAAAGMLDFTFDGSWHLSLPE